MPKWDKFLSKESSLLKTSEIRDLLKLTEGKNVLVLQEDYQILQLFLQKI